MKTIFKNIFFNGINAVITTQCLDLLFYWQGVGCMRYIYTMSLFVVCFVSPPPPSTPISDKYLDYYFLSLNIFSWGQRGGGGRGWTPSGKFKFLKFTVKLPKTGLRPLPPIAKQISPGPPQGKKISGSTHASQQIHEHMYFESIKP